MSESAIGYATRRVTESIPKDILEKAFKAPMDFFTPNFTNSYSLRSIIEEEVIRGSLNRDLQALTSKEVTIPLGGLPIRLLPDYSVVVHIPLQLTAGRVIQDCVRINYWQEVQQPLGTNPTNTFQGDMYTLMMNDIVDSVSPIQITGTSRVEMVGPNTILANIGPVTPSWMSAVVMVEPDPEMTGVLPAMYEDYAILAELKAKALIYTNTITRLERGEILAGAELGEIKNQIERYSDANESYRDKLQTWRTTQACADIDFASKLIQLQLGQFRR